MYNFILTSFLVSTFLVLTGCSSYDDSDQKETFVIKASDKNQIPVEELNITDTVILGKALFQDKDLSFSHSLSCSSCHSIDHAMVDDRVGSNIGASLGDDGNSLGDRNAPMVTYASYSPTFSSVGNTAFRGGQFWDGRASTLIDQAKGPFLNDIEMQMPDIALVVARIMEKEVYVLAFKKFYGDTIFDTDEDAFEALAKAIADYESSPEVSTFDSKFDKYQKGEVNFTDQERLGESLFESSGCFTCHTNRSFGNVPALFSSYSYHNIGVPKNNALRLLNGVSSTYIDKGLSNRDDFNDTAQDGLFKMPSLRNIAVTAPYTHNGGFKTLKAMVHFYNTRDVAGAINPDTNLPWEPSEVMTNRFKRVGNLKLTDEEEDAIIAFLKTLTDERYEVLLK